MSAFLTLPLRLTIILIGTCADLGQNFCAEVSEQCRTALRRLERRK